VTTGKGTAQQWPIFIAMAKGYLAESKIDLDVVAVSSAASGIQQLAAGSAETEMPFAGYQPDPLTESINYGRFRFPSCGRAGEFPGSLVLFYAVQFC